jgi:hypothetical protein
MIINITGYRGKLRDTNKKIIAWLSIYSLEFFIWLARTVAWIQRSVIRDSGGTIFGVINLFDIF